MKRPITIHIHTTVDVSEDYPDDSLLFMYNEGTHCINNDLERLVAQLHEDPWECQCPNAWITLGHAEHPYRINSVEAGRSEGRPTTAAGIAADLINAVDRSIVSSERPKVGQPLPAQVQKAETTTPGACAAVTRKSQRCKVPADQDSEFCHLHRPDGAYQRNLAKDWESKGVPIKKEPYTGFVD